MRETELRGSLKSKILGKMVKYILTFIFIGGKFIIIPFPPSRPPRNTTGSEEIIPSGFSPKVIGMNKSRDLP